ERVSFERVEVRGDDRGGDARGRECAVARGPGPEADDDEDHDEHQPGNVEPGTDLVTVEETMQRVVDRAERVGERAPPAGLRLDGVGETEVTELVPDPRQVDQRADRRSDHRRG